MAPDTPFAAPQDLRAQASQPDVNPSLFPVQSRELTGLWVVQRIIIIGQSANTTMRHPIGLCLLQESHATVSCETYLLCYLYVFPRGPRDNRKTSSIGRMRSTLTPTRGNRAGQRRSGNLNMSQALQVSQAQLSRKPGIASIKLGDASLSETPILCLSG
jgi:hypothetical protein